MYLLSLDDLCGEQPLCWRAFTPCSADGRSRLRDEIQQLLDDSNLSGAIADLVAMLGVVLARPAGPRMYQGVLKRCHEAVAGAQIYEFIKGPLRLYWFYGEDRQVIIVPAVYHKKQQKTPKEIVQMLRRAQQEYREGHRQGSLTYL